MKLDALKSPEKVKESAEKAKSKLRESFMLNQSQDYSWDSNEKEVDGDSISPNKGDIRDQIQDLVASMKQGQEEESDESSSEGESIDI